MNKVKIAIKCLKAAWRIIMPQPTGKASAGGLKKRPDKSTTTKPKPYAN